MYKLLYLSIRVRTAPPVSVRVRTRVSVIFSFTFLFFETNITSKKCIALSVPSFELVHGWFCSLAACVVKLCNGAN